MATDRPMILCLVGMEGQDPRQRANGRRLASPDAALALTAVAELAAALARVARRVTHSRRARPRRRPPSGAPAAAARHRRSAARAGGFQL